MCIYIYICIHTYTYMYMRSIRITRHILYIYYVLRTAPVPRVAGALTQTGEASGGTERIESQWFLGG